MAANANIAMATDAKKLEEEITQIEKISETDRSVTQSKRLPLLKAKLAELKPSVNASPADSAASAASSAARPVASAAAASSSTTAPFTSTEADINTAISTNEKRQVTVEKIGKAEDTLIDTLRKKFGGAIIYAVLPLRIATTSSSPSSSTSEGGRRTRRHAKRSKRSKRTRRR